MIGADNQYVSSAYGGWVDMFCWGTSGWNGGCVKSYQPYSVGGGDDSEFLLPNGNCAFLYNTQFCEYANADWGVYNKVSNGENEAGLWRTLMGGERSYLYIHVLSVMKEAVSALLKILSEIKNK